MGGIKNKLTKQLSNKTIPLSDYRLTSPFSQRGTKNTVNKGSLSLKGAGSPLGLTEGSLSAGLSLTILTKYLGIACLLFAILSTLVLNIVSSYSYSKVNSNAEPVAQANSTLVSGPAEISLSISPITTPTSSQCDTSNSNICMSIPDDGGIATGGHTIKVSSNSYAGYNVQLSASEANNNETSLANVTNGSGSITTTTGNLSAPSKLANNTWGYVLTNPTGQETNAIWAGLQPSTNKTSIITTNSLSNQTDNYSVYYGVKVDNPSQLLAGDYQTQVVYTATVKLPGKPTISSVTPDSYALDSGASGQVTITGANLGSAYSVYLTNANGDRVGDCANLSVTSDTSLTCTILTAGIPAGDYTIHVVTQGGESSISFEYTKPKVSLCRSGGANNTCQVDIDDNMIPVKYTGSTTVAQWTSIANKEDSSNIGEWYDYDDKQWANAVTVKDPSKYKGKSQVVSESDILGYWVYIPRYAYKIMRKETVNKVVTDTDAVNRGGFDIYFEKAGDVVKTPTTICDNSTLDYQECIKQTKGDQYLEYPGNDEPMKDQTAWATHPAFTWRSEELNGFWIGKFETTGSTTQPTVLPNQHHIGEAAAFGVYYDIAKSMGQYDRNNTGGNGTAVSQNNQKLATAQTHMMKNKEWGAVAYLSGSKYGAGVNNVQLNGATTSGYDGNHALSEGATGCGPASSGSKQGYANGAAAGTPYACNAYDSSYSYIGSIGKLSSTTNNEYGIYDMNGGSSEVLMGNLSASTSMSQSSAYLVNPAPVPYVDLYPMSIFGVSEYFDNNNLCTWQTCGGQSLYETVSSYPDVYISSSWGGAYAAFVSTSSSGDYSWFIRGAAADTGTFSGIFGSYALWASSLTGSTSGFRVVLLVEQ